MTFSRTIFKFSHFNFIKTVIHILMTDYLKSHYNLDDPDFVSIIDEVPLWSAPFGLKILDTIQYKRRIKVLDIGLGLGFPSIELAMRLGNSSKVYGLDPWKAGIERAKQKMRMFGLSNVEFFEGCAEQMPFESTFFDLIVSNNGINNVQDVEKTFQECNRVSKIGARFVFTFNTDRTFKEFYNIYRQVLNENNLEKYNDKITEHIYSKRKPVSEIENYLKYSGFKIDSIHEDIFYYQFSDGTAMLNHAVIKYAFMESWKKIIPIYYQVKIFKQIENRLNAQAAKAGGFSMQVPFVTMDCEKEKNPTLKS